MKMVQMRQQGASEGGGSGAQLQVKHSADEMTGPLAAAIEQFGQHLAQTHAQQMEANRQQTELLTHVAKHIAAPKRIVRDAKGRASHTETILQ